MTDKRGGPPEEGGLHPGLEGESRGGGSRGRSSPFGLEAKIKSWHGKWLIPVDKLKVVKGCGICGPRAYTCIHAHALEKMLADGYYFKIAYWLAFIKRRIPRKYR